MFKIDPYTTSTPMALKKKASINKHTINQTNKPDEFYLFLVSFKQHWIFLNPYLHLTTKYFCVSFMFLPMHYFLFHPTLTYLIQICWNMVHIFFKCSLWLLCTHMKYQKISLWSCFSEQKVNRYLLPMEKNFQILHLAFKSPSNLTLTNLSGLNVPVWDSER